MLNTPVRDYLGRVDIMRHVVVRLVYAAFFVQRNITVGQRHVPLSTENIDRRHQELLSSCFARSSAYTERFERHTDGDGPTVERYHCRTSARFVGAVRTTVVRHDKRFRRQHQRLLPLHAGFARTPVGDVGLQYSLEGMAHIMMYKLYDDGEGF